MFALWRKLWLNRAETDVNRSVANGLWGERTAVWMLRHKGYRLLARNCRPYRRDKRLEIDVVAYDQAARTLVFVEVKQHAKRQDGYARLRSITPHKCRLLRRACQAWLRSNRWQGAYRFDVIEIYGVPRSRQLPVIDHIERVRLFAQESIFVDWSK